MKQMSEAAIVAKEIRAILKVHGVKGRVRSNNYSGGNSVWVYFDEQIADEMYAKIFAAADRFRAGSFNSMEDIYEYRDMSGPSVSYISFINQGGYTMGYPKAEAA